MRRTTLVASVVAASVATAAWDHPFPIAATASAAAQPPVEPPPAAAAPPEEAPAPAPPEAPVPVPAPAPAADPVPPAPAPAPPPAIIPPPEFVSPSDGWYGPMLRVQPAHRIAMMEAGHEVPETDPQVARAAYMLSQLTGHYLEDAPRIVDLTIKATTAVRKAKGSASPMEIMESALKLKRPAGSRAVGPRRFDSFVTRYRQARVEGGKDHAGALTEMQNDAAPPAKPR